jgi:DNA-binding LacI/PurR family transcriptional regulator
LRPDRPFAIVTAEMTDQTAGSTATIFDIAEAAGVSITTVSHVFSGNRPVGTATRQKVLEAAERLDYRPRGSARALATGRTMTLALQISFSGPELLFNPFFTSLLPAMSEAAIELGYSFAFVPADAAESFVEPLIARRTVDAAILIDPRPGDRFVAEVLAERLPYVSLGRVLGAPAGPRVDHDHLEVCRAVVDHLRAERYERIAMLSIREQVSYVIDLEAAFRTIVPDGAVIAADALSVDAGRAVAAELLAGDDRPDALFCANDVLAVGVLQAAAAAGVRVPEDLGVVGVEDSSLARHAEPPLTSISAHPEEAGRLLIATMDRVLSGELDVPPTVVPIDLVIRASSTRS